ncbi:MAG: TonB-dependent receptor [Algibacter sp.]
MKKQYYLLLIFLTTFSIYSQEYNLKGQVKDSKNEPLIGVNIINKKNNYGVQTDINGSFLLIFSKVGIYELTASYLGYKTKKIIITISENNDDISITMDESNLSLDEVVISASRTSEKISEVPASITIVGAKELELLTQSTTNISEILEFAVPGLAPSTGTYSNWGQTLRGRNLLVMIDGIPQSTPLRNAKVDLKTINPNDIARIEVIKGATAIYGNGGDGGIVNYITKKAAINKKIGGNSKLWQTANLTKTEDAFGWGVYQSLTGKVNKLSYYISGSFEQTGNKYDADGDVLLPTYSLGNTNIFSGLAKIGYEITDNQKLSISATHYKSKQDSPFVATLGSIEVFNADGDYKITHGIGELPSDANPTVGGPTGTTTTSVQLKYAISDLFNETTSLDTDVYYQNAENIFFYSNSFEGGGQSVVNSEKFGFQPNFHTEFALEAPINLSFTYGIDILKDKTNQGLTDGRLWVPNLDFYSYAPYLQAKIKYKNTWILKTGIRYDNMNLSIDDFSTLPYDGSNSGTFNPSVAITGDDLKFKSTSVNIGIRYIKNDPFIPYVSYSQGFSLPDIGGTIRGATAASIEDIDLTAVETNNFEFGFLSKFQHIRFEAVGFYSTSNLGLGLQFNNDTNRFEATKTPQKIYGAEASIDFNYLQRKLQFGGSYSYVEGLTHDDGNPNDLRYIGGDVVSPPKTTAYINAKPLENLNTSLRLVGVGNRNRFNAIENAGTFTYNYREAPVKGYVLLNFSTDYTFKSRIKISITLNNLLNKFYLPARAQWAAPLRNQTTAGEGINAKLGLSFDF